MVQIQSHSNPKFKALKGLLKSRTRKRGRVFMMEGRPELDHALNSGWKVKTIAYCEAYIEWNQISAMLEVENDIEVLSLGKSLFDDLAYQQVPGNFLVVFEKFECTLEQLDPQQPVVLLESLEKPGNLGAVMRTCDALGIHQLLVCNSEIDLFNPNVLRNSRGAVASVKTVFTTNERAHQFIQQHQLSTYAAALTEDAVPFHQINPGANGVFCFGAESKGLSDFWLDRADRHLVIPMRGVVDSLNLSVSVAMMLSHFFIHDPS